MRCESSAQHLYNLGKQARDNGDIAAAKSLWKQAVAQEPRNAQFHASLANMYTKEGAFDEAIPCWREAVRNNPGDARFANGLGGVLRHRKQYGEASNYFQRARDLNPDNALYAQNLEECRNAQAAFHTPNTSRPTPAYSQPQTGEAYRFPRPAPAPQPQYNPGRQPAPAPQPNPAPTQGPHATCRTDLPPDKRTKTFGVNSGDYPYYDFPLERRGVPKHMFEADMAEIRKICDRIDRAIGLGVIGCLTFGLAYAFVCCFCGGPGSQTSKGLDEKIREMNLRYAPYGVTWHHDYAAMGTGTISMSH